MMPMYEYACTGCRHYFETLTPIDRRDAVLCSQCGRTAEREWRHAPAMRPDSIPGGRIIENLTSRPKRFYSRTEIQDEMRVRGVEQRVKHVGLPGSDKNPNTSRWI